MSFFALNSRILAEISEVACCSAAPKPSLCFSEDKAWRERVFNNRLRRSSEDEETLVEDVISVVVVAVVVSELAEAAAAAAASN